MSKIRRCSWGTSSDPSGWSAASVPMASLPLTSSRLNDFTARCSCAYGNRGNDSPDYLAFPGGVYTVDFSQRTIQSLFSPPAGETILTAHRFEDRQQKRSLAMILTDKSIHVVDDAGERVFSAPLVYGLGKYTDLRAGQLEDGQGYVVWYGRASWWSRRPSADRTPSHLVQYDAGGREIARQELPALPFAEPSPGQAMMGLVTPLAGYVLRGCVAESLGDRAAWSLGMAGRTLAGFTALMLLSAIVCAVANSRPGSALRLFRDPPFGLVALRLSVRTGRPAAHARVARVARAGRLPSLSPASRRHPR